MKEIMASIVCLTFNHEKFIAEAIESFLAQRTSFPFEIIIHDDASKDKTTEIVKKYAEKYAGKITAIIQHENQYSKGIKPFAKFVMPRIRGKYIAWCEGDDFWTDPYKLQKQVEFLETNSEYVICYHNAVVINEQNQLVTNSKLPDFCKKDLTADELKIGAWVLMLTACFRNVIKDLPDEFYKVRNGDTFLTSMLGNYGKGKYMPDIKNAVYRQHGNSVWSSLSIIEKNTFSINTFAWLHRYYSRIGDKTYSDYFERIVITLFKSSIEKWYDSGNEKICSIFSKLIDDNKDIMNIKTLMSYQKYIGEAIFYKLALLNFNQKKYSEAILYFHEIAKLNPMDATVFNNLGVIYYNTGKLQEAEKNFKKALDLKPAYREALLGMEKIHNVL